MSEPAKISEQHDDSGSLEASFKAIGDRLEAIRTKPNRATLALMLHAGGDHRIWPDPLTGRNRYGTKAVPAPSEISFASTTASTISPMSFDAVGETYSRLFEVGYGPGLSLPKWFGELRSRIVSTLARPGDEAILAASGTDAAVIALGLARGLAKRPITAISFAPEETGAGIPRATAGQHFSDMTALGAMVDVGTPIKGLGEEITTNVVALRGAQGIPREMSDIDGDVAHRTEAALAAGRDVVITLLDTAKTGIGSMSRTMAKALAEKSPANVHVIVDACQLRCPRSQIKSDLEAGFIVTVTGSKFIAGPAFCGAVLVPKATADALSALPALAPGLASYSAALDWPLSLRHLLGSDLSSEANLGVGFRWTAALEHLERLCAIEDATEHAIMKRIVALARDLARHTKTANLHLDDLQGGRGVQTMLLVGVSDASGERLGADVATRLHRDLRETDACGPVCHLGQPVHLEAGSVLRISASALDVVETAARLDAGQSMDAALEPVRRRLETVFEKWNRLMLSGR